MKHALNIAARTTLLAATATSLSIGTAPSANAAPLGSCPKAGATAFADVTGDGLADAIKVNTDGVCRSSLKRLAVPEGRTLDGRRLLRLAGNIFRRCHGDGLADAITVNADRVWVRRSNGSQFLLREPWAAGPYFGSRGTFFADVTVMASPTPSR